MLILIICLLSSTKNNIFRFKQFEVDQSGCAMKINTDGSILGALAGQQNPTSILDIGTGTGVIALMLAQRFQEAHVNAVEIETTAAATAERNFQKSVFSNRLKLFPVAFQEFLTQNTENKYDLVVSNPPFFLDSLKNPDKNKQTARHTTNNFFEELVKLSAKHLNAGGMLTLILPPSTYLICRELAEAEGLYLAEQIDIKSFVDSEVHRKLVSFSFQEQAPSYSTFVIYASRNQYSGQFVNALGSFFTIF